MEKITLKPAVKEFLYRSGEENVYFDVLSYRGSTTQEKNLGAIFVISHIKYLDEDLSYLVSLISSLAKREYYSEVAIQEQNPKQAFSQTLKKLNEVLEEFFQNKDFKLNIGLVAISGENIYISRLGKFKINLARGNQFIDILNNIELFNKDITNEKQFSNIISGKLQQNDRLFAFFPTRSITSREKQLNDVFIKESQEGFGQKIAHLAANANNFSCCGMHIDIQQIKEIPFQSLPRRSIPAPSQVPYSAPVRQKSELPKETAAAPALSPLKKEVRPDFTEIGNKETDSESYLEPMSEERKSFGKPPAAEQPRIIPAELSVTKRSGIFLSLAAWLKKIRLPGLPGYGKNRTRLRPLIFLAAFLIIAFAALILLKTTAGPQVKNAITLANENLKLAQSYLSQNNTKEARILLQAALLNISDLPNKKIGKIKTEINQILANLDRVSEKLPSIFSDFGNQIKDSQAVLITAAPSNPMVINAVGVLFSIAPDRIDELAKFKTAPKFIFGAEALVAAFDDTGEFAVFDLKSKKIASYSLKNPSPALDAALYENNLYTLSENHIYKYADVITGSTKKVEWGYDSDSGKLIALTVDGNIYALNDSGKLIKYYKGKKLAEFDLQVAPSAGIKIFTAKDSAFIYLADKINRKVYVFDKSNGELKTSYDLTVIGKVQDILISPDNTIWILSADNKVWSLK